MEQKTTVSLTSEAQKDLEALKYVCDKVTATLGANGKIVHIYKNNFHRFTKDGITVLSDLTLHGDKDIARMASLIMQAAYTQLSQVGDGTTTATLLAYEMYLKLLEVKDKANISDRELRAWLSTNIGNVVKHITDNKLVCDEKRIKQIAAISANNDPSVGNIIGDLVWKVGKYGNILVERKENSAEITTELRDGYFFESPSRLPLNHKAVPMPNGKIDLSDCWVLTTNVNFSSIASVAPVFGVYSNMYVKTGEVKPLIVICEDISGEALGAVEASIQQAQNPDKKIMGFDAMPLIFIKAAYAQEMRGEFLSDIHNIVGGQLWDNRVNAWTSVETQIENGTFEIGQCDRFTFVNGRGATIYGEATEEYIKSVQGKYDSELNPNWKEFYGQRLGKLKPEVASLGVIYIGANTEGEGSLRYDVIDDTWKACMSALKQGCVYGGGYALYQAYTAVKNDKYGLFRDVLLAPFTKMTGGSVYPHEKGVFNCITQKWEHTKDTNILDPADAPITALVCAANVAFLLATKEYSIIHKSVEA